MNAGVAHACAPTLVPDIALFAAQMTQLTANFIRLVEQKVTLADGSRQRA